MQREALHLVFSNRKYLALSILIFGGLLMVLSMISEFIFISPVFVFYVPPNGIANFVLIVIVAALSGIVVSLSTFRISSMGKGMRKSGMGFFGSMVGASAGACSCGPLGFTAISTFGSIGGTVTLFLANYETPLRLVAIAILSYTYYVSVKAIVTQCKIA